MKTWTRIAVALVALAAAAPALAETPAQLEANKKVVLDFYENGLQMQNMAVASSYLSNGYIQHNPTVPTGKAGFVKAFSARWAAPPAGAPAPKINPPVLVIAEKDLVTLVFKYDAPDPSNPGQTYPAFWFDTFRVKDGKLTEHWDPQRKPEIAPVADKTRSAQR